VFRQNSTRKHGESKPLSSSFEHKESIDKKTDPPIQGRTKFNMITFGSQKKYCYGAVE
jgi:hypothetical protein